MHKSVIRSVGRQDQWVSGVCALCPTTCRYNKGDVMVMMMMMMMIMMMMVINDNQSIKSKSFI